MKELANILSAMRDNVKNDDHEMGHSVADRLLCAALIALAGESKDPLMLPMATEIVSAFKATERHYS